MVDEEIKKDKEGLATRNRSRRNLALAEKVTRSPQHGFMAEARLPWFAEFCGSTLLSWKLAGSANWNSVWG